MCASLRGLYLDDTPPRQVASVLRPGLKRQRSGASSPPGCAPSSWLRNVRAPVETTPLGAKVVVDPKTGRRLLLGPAVAAKISAPDVGGCLIAGLLHVAWLWDVIILP